MANGMKIVICIVIFWVASAMILLTPKVFEDVNRKLKVKDWLPTVLLAPILILLNSPKFQRAVTETGPKKKERRKEQDPENERKG